MERTRLAFGVVLLWRLPGQHERRLDGEASRAADKVVAMEKVEGVVEALLAHVRKNLGLGWEENSDEAADVLLVDFDARVRQVYLKEEDIFLNTSRKGRASFAYVVELWRWVAWADVRLAAEGRHRHCVVVEHGQIVGESAVHVADSMEFRWKDAREDGDEAGAQEGVEQIPAAVKLRNDHVFAIVDSCQRDVELAVHPNVSVFGQIADEAVQQTRLNVEGG